MGPRRPDRLLGRAAPDRPSASAARRASARPSSGGEVDAEVSDLSSPENRFERCSGKLLEVYLPVEDADRPAAALRDLPALQARSPRAAAGSGSRSRRRCSARCCCSGWSSSRSPVAWRARSHAASEEREALLLARARRLGHRAPPDRRATCTTASSRTSRAPRTPSPAAAERIGRPGGPRSPSALRDGGAADTRSVRAAALAARRHLSARPAPRGPRRRALRPRRAARARAACTARVDAAARPAPRARRRGAHVPHRPGGAAQRRGARATRHRVDVSAAASRTATPGWRRRRRRAASTPARAAARRATATSACACSPTWRTTPAASSTSTPSPGAGTRVVLEVPVA